MAVTRSSAGTDPARELILSLREIRNTVRDERKKRLAKEPAKTRLTYHSGQESRTAAKPVGTGRLNNTRGASNTQSFGRSRRK